MEWKPDVGYEDGLVWIPKERAHLRQIKAALTFIYGNANYQNTKKFSLYRERKDHIGIPRHFLNRRSLASMGMEMVDLQPQSYEEIDIYSSIQPDALQPGKTMQSDAITAALSKGDGIVSLACVTGDTTIAINRRGKGWKVSVEHAFRAFHGEDLRFRWPGLNGPTRVRSLIGNRIGLNELLDVVKMGMKPVFLLELEDGKSLKLTSDHLVLTPDGYRSIDQGLHPGDLVITDSGQVKWGKKSVRHQKPKPVYRRLNWYANHPYAHRNGNKYGPQIGMKQTWTLEEHRAVAEASLNGMVLKEYRNRFRNDNLAGLRFIDPSRFHVHHQDGNPRNNDPANLEVLPISEHHGMAHVPDPRNFGYGVPTPVVIRSITPAGEEVVYDVMCKAPNNNFVANGIVIHNCGNGKTLVGLHIWAQLRVPLVVMADNTSILEGWVEQIRMFITPKDLPIGRVYDGEKDWDKPVVLVSVQSLMRMAEKGFPPELGKKFGLFIADETHKIAAPKFSLTAPLFMGRRLGLTATPERTDRLHPVYEYHFGKVIYQNLEQPLTPTFEFYTPVASRNLMENPSFRRRSMSYGDVNVQKIWSALAEEDVRTGELANLIKRRGHGRRTLVISQRKEMLHRLHDLLPGSDVIVSETDLKKRSDVLQKADIVLGIMGIAKEGLNSVSLSMLVICEPFKDQNLFQQTVGRILRDVPGKPNPQVIIIADSLGKEAGPVFGLVRAMKKTIMTWPEDRGGPYTWTECSG